MMAPHVLPRRWIVALCGAVVLGSLGVLPASSVAAATTYTVNALTDTGAGAGTVGDLRYAINQVNAGSGGDTIKITATGTMTPQMGVFTLMKNVTINGPGATALALGNFGFVVNSGVTATISDLSIQRVTGAIVNNGTLAVHNMLFASNRSAITNSGSLTISNSAFTGNTSEGSGGAIYSSGTLHISSSVFANNRSSVITFSINFGTGGAIDSTGTLFVTTSTFTNNFAGADAGAGHNGGTGGAIAISGTATITNSTFTANHVLGGFGGGAGGGAIANSGTSSFTNLTIVYNTASALSFAVGGGIDNSGILTVTNCTIAGNSAANSMSGGIANGGGIANNSPPGTVNLTNTIVAQNTGGALGGYDLQNGFMGDNNLIDDATNAAGFTDGMQGNIVGHPAMLGTLTDNGGPTQTIPLLLGSPAINAGAPIGSGPSDNPVPANDQRGFTRVNAPDIGAFEVQDATCTGSTPLSIKVGQTVACNASVQSSDPTIVAVDASGNITGVRPGQVTLTVTQGGVTGTVTVIVTGPTPIGISVPAAPQSRPAGVTSGSNTPSPAPGARPVTGGASPASPSGPPPNPLPGARP